MAITKATPRPVQEGIKDNSARAIPLEQEQIPQHMPVFFIQSARGPLTTQFTSGTAMLKMFGSQSFDENSKFFSHQTMMLTRVASEANLVAIRRVVDGTAKPGAFCLAVEKVAETLVVYERDADGDLVLDVNGNPVPVVPAATVSGFKKRLILLPGVDATNFKTQVKKAGTLTNAGGDVSEIVPIMSGIADVGSYGNNLGFRLEVPNMAHSSPSDNIVAEERQTSMYRWSWWERADERSTPNRLLSILMEREVDFSFLKGVSNPRTNKSYDKTRVLSSYERRGVGIIPIAGPVNEIFFYEANILELLGQLFTAETAAAAAQGQVMTLTSAQQMNLFNSQNWYGKPYFGVEEAAGGIAVDGLTTHYLTGGNDGVVSEAALATLAATWLRGNWDDPAEPFNDWAQYPVSQLYDSGFPLDTKYAFLEAMGKRDDLKVDVATQDLSLRPNDIATEISVGTSLRAKALLIPESVIHGTQTCRASVWGSMGEIVNTVYPRMGTMLLDVAVKRAKYMGAGDGILKSIEAFDVREKNSVTQILPIPGVTHTYLSMGIKDKYWDLGINYVQYRDRTDLFWPAYQTVYSDDTSSLNSDITVSCLVNIKKKANYHWAINTGDSKLSKDEFIERSNEDFGRLIQGRYDNRLAISYDTVFTPMDNQRGYSWSLDINAATDPMRTVGQYNITVSRPD